MQDPNFYFSELQIIFQELEAFLLHKNHQNLIYALLQIKKSARKRRAANDSHSVSVKSHSYSKSHLPSRKPSLVSSGVASQVERNSRRSSNDLMKGTESLNQVRSNANHQKIYTQSIENYGDGRAGSTKNGRYSIPDVAVYNSSLNKLQKGHFVPRLQGLTSVEDNYDFQPYTAKSSNNIYRHLRHEEQSIMEEEEEDFEDLVLHRLQNIEEKLKKMLYQKRHRIQPSYQMQKRNLSKQYSQYLSRDKLQRVSTIGNKNSLYPYPSSRLHNYSAVGVRHNLSSVYPSQRQLTERKFPTLTERVNHTTKHLQPRSTLEDKDQYIQNNMDLKVENFKYIPLGKLNVVTDHSKNIMKTKRQAIQNPTRRIYQELAESRHSRDTQDKNKKDFLSDKDPNTRFTRDNKSRASFRAGGMKQGKCYTDYSESDEYSMLSNHSALSQMHRQKKRDEKIGQRVKFEDQYIKGPRKVNC